MPRDEQEPASPWTRPWFIASACVVGVLVVIGVLVAVLPGRDAPPQGGAPTASPTAAATTAAASDSVCGLEPGDQEIPAGPIKADWELVGRVKAPTSGGLGPGVTDADGWRYCYAHSPSGAALAVANLVALQSHPDLSSRVVRDLTVDGPGRDAQLAYLEEVGEEQARQEILEGAVPTVRGYRVVSYKSSAAAIDLLFSLEDTTDLYSITYELGWDEGDWHYSPADDLAPDGGKVTSSAGFIEWGAS